MVTAIVILASVGLAFLGITAGLVWLGWHPVEHASLVRRHDREMQEG